MLKTAKPEVFIFIPTSWIHSRRVYYHIQGWKSHPLDSWQKCSQEYEKKRSWFLNFMATCGCLCMYICKCVFVSRACVWDSRQAWQTISGSVPRPLQCLIGRTDQSERGLVVPTIRPCVPRARVWGGQCATTTRYSAALQNNSPAIQLISRKKAAELDSQASNYWRASILKSKIHILSCWLLQKSAQSRAVYIPSSRLIAILKASSSSSRGLNETERSKVSDAHVKHLSARAGVRLAARLNPTQTQVKNKEGVLTLGADCLSRLSSSRFDFTIKKVWAMAPDCLSRSHLNENLSAVRPRRNDPFPRTTPNICERTLTNRAETH